MPDPHAPPPDDLVLALDQGGGSSRALVFDAAGRVVAKGQCDVGETRFGGDRVEQDPEELVRSLRRAIKEAVKHLGRREGAITAAGLATQRASLVAWDRSTGAALTPVLSWQDRRARDRVDALASHGPEVRARTGLRLSPHYGASKLAWCVERVPAVAEALRAGTLLAGPLASFLAFRLLDERPEIADPANASRTLLWNVATREFDPWLCDLFGVPIVALPRPVWTRGAHGTLDVGKRKVPLTVLTGDQSAALYSAGEPRDDAASVVFGTGAFVQRTFGEAAIDAPRLLKSVARADAGGVTFALEGTVNGAGSALHWAVEDQGREAVSLDLERLLRAETDPPIFVNAVSGLGAPFWVPDLQSSFAGLGSPDARLAAVLESVVFLVAIVIREMALVLPAPRLVRASGGLGQLDGLCQRLADLTGARVERSRDPESTARGLAWLVRGGGPAWAAETDLFEPRADPALVERAARFEAAVGSAIANR